MKLFRGVFFTLGLLAALGTLVWYFLPALMPKSCVAYSPFIELSIRGQDNVMDVPPAPDFEKRFSNSYSTAVKIAKSSWYSLRARKVAVNAIAEYAYIDVNRGKALSDIIELKESMELREHCEWVLELPVIKSLHEKYLLEKAAIK